MTFRRAIEPKAKSKGEDSPQTIISIKDIKGTAQKTTLRRGLCGKSCLNFSLVFFWSLCFCFSGLIRPISEAKT